MGLANLKFSQRYRNLSSFRPKAVLRAASLLLLAVVWNCSPTLWAQAQAPSVTLKPTSLTFGTQVVGTTGGSEPVVESVVLKNNGTAPLSISNISIKGNYSQTNNCPPTLAAGSSCSVDVTFRPDKNGVSNGTLEFTDSAPDSPQQVSVIGTGSVFNVVHIHLLLNHFPIIGTIIGLGLFLIALIGKSEDLQRASLVVFLGMALITMPTFMSGSAAQDAIKFLPGVPLALITAHLNASLLAYVFIEITGAFAWFGLWEYRRNGRLGRATLTTVLLLSIVTIVLMSNAGNLGGKIRHEEIMYGPELAPTSDLGIPALGLNAAAIGAFVRETKWVWPTLQTLHFMGLSLLLGVVFLVDLRVLGMMRGVSFATVHRLLPWGVLGFALNVFTGMCYWVAAPYQYTLNTVFYWKVVFMMVAGINAIYLTLFEEPWALQAGDEAPLRGKLIAASVVALWIGVIFCGIMLPFLGSAF
ncbi:MAG: choice-of-anchor D domain-containing protein [Candidatus Acidiferrales bacterium]|jgi:uncharacterized membrane protein